MYENDVSVWLLMFDELCESEKTVDGNIYSLFPISFIILKWGCVSVHSNRKVTKKFRHKEIFTLKTLIIHKIVYLYG